ncbi:MAG: lysine--tRNA ligase [Candidatus Cloacimonas sp. 4484_209]|nr:MAG: lysine--tRNA ligase [Candidatus Cloacimonas sp. 4484_209]
MEENGGRKVVDNEELFDQKRIRIEKLEKLRELGVNPYPYRFETTHTTADIKNQEKEIIGKDGISIAGRIMAKRGHGKTVFADLKDKTGKLQVYFRKDKLGDKPFEIVKLLDIGDFIGVTGEIFRTGTGEITLLVKDFILLAKSLFPLPEKWHGLKDKETRYRKRYLDLMMNDDVKETFIIRAKIIKRMREILNGKGFIEVETPVLQPLYGGAFAKPFKTYYNVLERDYFLRISDELYLKRLIIGGIDKVYEICKDFRNEGIDKLHNPEFTMMEAYEAYADYLDMLNLTEELITDIVKNINGNLRLEFQGKEIDFSRPWRKVSFYGVLKDYAGKDLSNFSQDELFAFAKEQGIDVEKNTSRGKLLDEIFSEKVEPNLIQPTFVIDYPIDISPLAKRHREKTGVVERFEPFVAGMEIGNAFSELNDPIDQRERFIEQKKMRESGDEEFQVLDEDFLTAMEHGMPPTGGLGIGIDRLVMILTNAPSIREVILFPQLKTKE